MSTEENRAVSYLEGGYGKATEANVSYVALPVDIAAGLLAYIAELEGKVDVPEESDTDSELAVGDTVKTMISYETVTGNAFPGNTVGVVAEITLEEYPIKVKFPHYDYPVGYERHELGKVS
jgi:hypothetical protein